MERGFERVGTIAGVLSPGVLLATVAFGWIASPTYQWPAEPFSLVGGRGDAIAAAFNAGLIATGLLALPFAVRLWRSWSRPVGGLYALVGVSFVGGGLFTVPSPLHDVFGAGILLGIWILLWTAALAEWREDERDESAIAFALGTAALAVWLPYDFGLESLQFGYGFAELVAFLAVAVWSVRTAGRLR